MDADRVATGLALIVVACAFAPWLAEMLGVVLGGVVFTLVVGGAGVAVAHRGMRGAGAR